VDAADGNPPFSPGQDETACSSADAFVDLLRWQLFVAGDPFDWPRDHRRRRDPTLGLPYDVRRALVRRAAALAPDWFEADVGASQLPIDLYTSEDRYVWARPVARQPLGHDLVGQLRRSPQTSAR
jgi:hypothetical protein